jgi:hypothetical protein
MIPGRSPRRPLRVALTAMLCAGALASPGAGQTDPEPPAGHGSPLAPPLEAAVARLCAHLGVGPEELTPPSPWPPSELQLTTVRNALSGPAAGLAETAPLIQLAEQADGLGEPSELAFLLESLAGGWLEVPLRDGLDLAPTDGAAAQLRAMGQELARWDAEAPGLSEDWKAALAQLVVDLARTREFLEQALAGLSAEDRKGLREALETVSAGHPADDPLTLGAQLLAADRLDRAALARAAASALVTVDAFLQLIPATEPTVGWRSDVPGVDGLALGPFETPAGPVYLGGPGPNRWHVPPAVLIDVAGRDRYEARARRPIDAGAPALTIVVDLAGDDVYVDGEGGSFAGARFGLALLRDLAGNDLYDGRRVTQGAAWVGAGLLVDDTGDDVYRADAWCQGSAGLGVGLLVDGAGADTYVAGAAAQGYASTLGVGLLADAAGEDSYRLARGRGQGAGEGHPDAEVAGGVGVLWDAGGDDGYRASSEAQGYGDWYGAGWLVDGDGDDGFTVRGPGQGHGQRFGAGGIIDLRGDDVRTARVGPAQASAREGGVAILYDGSGNDTAAVGGAGLGHASGQGVSLYLDARGDDLYVPAEAAGALGYGDRSDGAGAWGLFVEAAGSDRYASPLAADERLWTAGSWGGGIDRRTGSAGPSGSIRPRSAEQAQEAAESSSVGVELPDGASLPSARRQLSGEDPAVRAAAARTLGVLGGAEEAGLLVRSAQEDPSAWVRGAASLALVELGREAAEPALLEALEPCAAASASARRCQLLVRAAASLLPSEPAGEGANAPSPLRRQLEQIATLGPEETGALIMELVFDVQLEP